MSKKQRYYVVWHGREPGIYTSWNACEAQVKGEKEAAFKSFDTREEAEHAFSQSPNKFIFRKKKTEADASTTPTTMPTIPYSEALCVDAACSGNPGAMEYRGVHIPSGKEVFHFGPVYGTNNIGEFLAIVHGLALIKQQGLSMPIFSDSRNALLWVKNKKCKTHLERSPRTEELYNLITRAELWLQRNSYTTPLYKWETKLWGEVPADFGRK